MMEECHLYATVAALQQVQIPRGGSGIDTGAAKYHGRSVGSTTTDTRWAAEIGAALLPASLTQPNFCFSLLDHEPRL